MMFKKDDIVVRKRNEINGWWRNACRGDEELIYKEYQVIRCEGTSLWLCGIRGTSDATKFEHSQPANIKDYL